MEYTETKAITDFGWMSEEQLSDGLKKNDIVILTNIDMLSRIWIREPKPKAEKVGGKKKMTSQ